MKKLLLFVFIILAFLATSCIPIEPKESAEVEQLREQNQYLTKQLLEGQTLIRDLQILGYAHRIHPKTFLIQFQKNLQDNKALKTEV